MKHGRRCLWIVGPLVVCAVACATSNAGDGGETGEVLPDAAGVDRSAPLDAGADGDASLDAPATPPCSPDGWCATTSSLPSPPRFEELWPLEGGAFAVDRDNGVFEFDGTGVPDTHRWSVINEAAGALGAVWASSRDDVWAGGDGGRVLHGTRSAGQWTWSTEIVVAHEPIVAIWGQGADVFVLSAHHLYRRRANGQGWDVELEKTGEAVPSECGDNASARALGTFSFRRIVARSVDDMWILGRKNVASVPNFTNIFCDYVVRRVGGQYETVSDCHVEVHGDEFRYCDLVASPPALHLWLDDAFSVVPGRLVGHWRGAYSAGPGHWYRIERGLGEGYEYASAETEAFGQSAWGASEDEVYVGATGRVYRSQQLWDGGALGLSSIALNGVPLAPTFKIRGRTANDVWAIGGAYALHKTKP